VEANQQKQPIILLQQQVEEVLLSLKRNLVKMLGAHSQFLGSHHLKKTRKKMSMLMTPAVGSQKNSLSINFKIKTRPAYAQLSSWHSLLLTTPNIIAIPLTF
jgi:hypothetical protein